jgi:hypothetical protein
VSSIAQRYPHLARLCGAYLHQDFDVGGLTADQQVARFAQELPPERVALARRDLARLLARVKSEPGLRHALGALGCAYRPPAPVSRWLKGALALLSRSSR